MSPETALVRDGVRERDLRAVALGAVLAAARATRWVLRRGAAVAAALAVSCAPGTTLPIPGGGWTGAPTLHVTPELVDEFPAVAAALVEAADDYCRAGLGCVKVVIGRGAHEAMVLDDYRAADSDNVGALAVEQQRGATRRIVFFRFIDGDAITYGQGKCNGRTRPDPYNVAAHELGHFLGYSHVKDPYYLMFEGTSCDRDLKLPEAP